MRKKWSFWDIIILMLEILSPIISIVITCFIPAVQELSADSRLAIIGTGIAIPVVLIQISITQGQNKTESDNEKNRNQIIEISEKINHISPVLEQVFLSGNSRVQRFAYRRFEEVCKTIHTAVNNNNSGNLRPNEYYEELLHLSDLILRDKDKNKKKFRGEIWAMTGFAEDEWIADEGYENLWTDKLKEMVEINAIKTRRLCLLPDSLYNTITMPEFSAPQESNHPFWGFLKLLNDYYGKTFNNSNVEHYIIKENDNPKLKEIRGFFAIKLTNGDLHILYGETVDSNGALTAKVLFDLQEIQEVRTLFERYAKSNYRIENIIPKISDSNGFIKYLEQHNIKI